MSGRAIRRCLFCFSSANRRIALLNIQKQRPDPIDSDSIRFGDGCEFKIHTVRHSTDFLGIDTIPVPHSQSGDAMLLCFNSEGIVMKFNVIVASTAVMLCLGCNAGSPPTNSKPAPSPSMSGSAPAAPSMTGAAPADNDMPGKAETSDAGATAAGATDGGQKAVAVTDNTAKLGPENSRVQFIGTHTGDKPDPRLGGFEQFSGTVSTEAGKLTAVALTISTDTLWTEIGEKLTNHLKSPDFLDTKEHPEIKFQSTKVETQDDGKASIIGDLTMHGVTKSITIPATVKITEDGITLTAEFTIDRTEFGMDHAVDKIEKAVALTVVVGEKTQPKKAG